jgi:hypothetical protein
LGNYLALADVGNSIVKLLRENMVPEPVSKPEFIGLCSPAEKSDFQLTLHLYSIVENGEFRPVSMVNAGENKLRFPPMSLTLFYLLTAHSSADVKSRANDEQRILGRAIQVLNDNRVLDGSKLIGTLADNNEALEVVFERTTHEEMLKLWSFPSVPYKLSVIYKVSPVFIESTKVREVKRVIDAEITVRQTKGR